LDVIEDVSGNVGDTDRILFTESVSASDLLFSRSVDDPTHLLIENSISGSITEVVGQFDSNSTDGVELIVFTDGTTLDRSTIEAAAGLATNTAPIDIILSNAAIDENSVAGAIVGDLTAIDNDSDEVFSFRIVSPENSSFTISGSQLVVAAGAILDFEASSQESIDIEVEDSAGNTFTGTFEITINDINEGPSTISGTGGDDSLTGTEFAEIIDSLDGNDTLVGLQGDDTLFGRLGDDVLNGGPGFDVLFGGEGVDILNGNSGQDMLFGENGDDILRGAGGNDTLQGGEGNDTLNGGDNNDLLVGGIGTDVLNGNDNADTLEGGLGADTLNAGSGEDNLNGGEGNDLLNAGVGHDVLEGGIGNDTLNADDGFDTLNGGDGTDLLNGGNGNDLLFGESGNDTLNGSNGFDTLNGGDGDDTLNAGNGDDVLFGNTGADGLNGSNGFDTLDGGVGDDTLNGGNGEDSLFGGADNDILNGNFNNDALRGGLGDDTLRGAQGSDVYLFGSSDGNDFIDENNGVAINVDQIAFDADVNPADLILSRGIVDTNDLIITNTITGSTIEVNRHFLDNIKGIEEIIFDDGTVWSRAAIALQVETTSNSSSSLKNDSFDFTRAELLFDDREKAYSQFEEMDFMLATNIGLAQPTSAQPSRSVQSDGIQGVSINDEDLLETLPTRAVDDLSMFL